MSPDRPAALIPISRLSLGRLLLIVIAAGLAWRCVRFALGFPVWGDEAFVAVNFLVRDYAGMLHPLEWGQIVPAVFMWIELAIVRALGPSEHALRLLPFLAGIAALLVFVRFARRHLAAPAALLAIGFLAAANYPIRHAAEVKPYATDLLISLLLTAAAWSFFCNPRRWLVLAGLIILALAGPWCSYPSVFVGGGVTLFLAAAGLRRRRWDLLVSAAVVGAALLVGFLSMYQTYGRAQADFAAGISEIEMWKKTFPPLTDPLGLLVWFVWMHTGNMLAYPVGGDYGASTVTFLLCIVGGVRLAQRRPLLLWLLVSPLLLALLAAFLKKYPYGGSARTMLYMAPAFCFLAGYGTWVLIARVLPRRFELRPVGARSLEWGSGPIVRTVACILIVIALAGTVVDLAAPYKSSVDALTRTTVRDLARQTCPDARWIVFNSPTKVDYAPWLGDWQGTGGQFVFEVARFAPAGRLLWAPDPATIAPDGKPVLLLSYRGVKAEFPEAQFERYLRMLCDRLGADPRHTRTRLKERDGRIEAIDQYVLQPMPASSSGQ